MSYAQPALPTPFLLPSRSAPTSPSSSSSTQARSSSHALKDTSHIPMYKKVLFSGLSGAIATTSIYPLAITKTKLQAEAGLDRSSPLQMMRSIWRSGGALGFYKGWPPNVVFVMPEKAIKLTMNDTFKRMLKDRGVGVNRATGELGLGAEMLAGGLAGTVQVSATNPMELLQILGATKSGPVSYTRLMRELGVSGLYTGVLSTLARDIPFSVVYFSMYAELKSALLHDNAQGNLAFRSFLAGSAAGTLAAAISCPMDVIKTRVHAAAVPTKLGFGDFVRREVDMWRTHASGIVRSEGWRALFRGVVPRCVIVSPLFGITMTCYEEFQQAFG